MKTSRYALLLFALTGFALSSFASTEANSSTKVIYGTDNRLDLYQVQNAAHLKLAESTVALVPADSVRASSTTGMMDITAQTFQQNLGVCKSERFSEQPSGAFCSGSLIGKNMLLTAGHCVTSASACAKTKFVFGYGVFKKGEHPNSVKAGDVYSCKKLIYRVQEGNGADFAIIETDREVKDHAPLKLAMGRRNTEIAKGTKIVMIGHPAGIPTKVDADKKVRDSSTKGYFTANTDSYGGNSGSAVFNQDTLEIEGVLVRGETDYVRKGDCLVSNVCAEDGCRGEDVTKVSAVIEHLPSFTEELATELAAE